MIQRAFVLGAGLGTRLRPLTLARPKPLVPVFNKPLITFALDHLIAAGIESFIINTHHLPEWFDTIFPDRVYRGREVQLLHEPELLGTGGGIKNAEALLRKGPFIVYSGDLLCDLDIASLCAEHLAQKNDVTLALRDTGLASGVSLDGGRITDIGGRLGKPGQYDFANISIWNPAMLDQIPPEVPSSFVPPLVEHIRRGGRVGGLPLNDGAWFNIGSRSEYLKVHQLVRHRAWQPAFLPDPQWPRAIADDARVDPSARLRGVLALGEGSEVGADAVLEDCILWSGARIEPGARLTRCIVADNTTAGGIHVDADLVAEAD